MPSNVRYTLKDSDITDLDEAIEKAHEMEENMLKSNIDPNIILGRV